MDSRRRFLSSGALGILTLSGGCRPLFHPQLANAAEAWQERSPASVQSDQAKELLLGYPINMNTPAEEFFEWRAQLQRKGIGRFAFNNVGNPFKKSPIPFNTHDYERETIIAFGEYFGFTPKELWGFLSNSGTDSNMHGLYMGRTLLKAKAGKSPRAYFTREAHYSVEILVDLLGLEPVIVATLSDGGMNPEDLRSKLEQSDRPALVIATIGTTFKGAIDSVDGIQKVLQGYPSYVHVDAALFGGYLPFTEHAAEVQLRNAHSQQPRYDSIAISCHKFFGFPSPAGLYLTRSEVYEQFNELFRQIHNPEYIHQVPGTITCSRDSVKPAEFRYFATESARRRQKSDAANMLDNTAYLMRQMQSRFPELQARRSNPLSNTVYFSYPGDAIVNKYSLATMHLAERGDRKRFAHVVVMPHVTRNVLDGLLEDLGKAASPRE